MIKNRIDIMQKIQMYYENDMNFINRELDFVLFFKGNEKVLTYITTTPFKHYFEGELNIENPKIKYILKVLPYSKSSFSNDNIFDSNRPENSEIVMHKLISDFLLSNNIPYIIIPYISFVTNIYPFVDPEINSIVDYNQKYMQFISKYHCDRYHDKVKLLFMEHGIDMKSYLIKNKSNFNLSDWKTMLFQIIITLSFIQEKYPSFKHNNLALNSIYVTNKKNESYNITFNQKIYTIPEKNYNFCLNNFSLSTIDGLVLNSRLNNNFLTQIGINNKINKYYDIHYLLSNILYICNENNIILPDEIDEFIDRNIPDKYQPNINKYTRIIVEEEITTPKEIIENETLFFEFRKIEKLDINKNEEIIL